MPESAKTGKMFCRRRGDLVESVSKGTICYPEFRKSLLTKYLTPLEIEEAREEGWNRVRAAVQGGI